MLTLKDMINREVHTNASYLIQELSSNEKYQDEILEFSTQPDYAASVEYFINFTADYAQLCDILDYCSIVSRENGLSAANLRDKVFTSIKNKEETCKKLTEEFDLDYEYIEALKYWIVSDWLADKLEEQGELVTNNFYNLSIWGRSCSGQSIEIDYVMQTIYNNLMK